MPRLGEFLGRGLFVLWCDESGGKLLLELIEYVSAAGAGVRRRSILGKQSRKRSTSEPTEELIAPVIKVPTILLPDRTTSGW